MRTFGAVLLLALLSMVLSCGGPSGDPDAEFKTLVAWMSGSFSSRAQAEADESYFHITLEMVPIWTERTDGAWLYVEQALAEARTRPYRQRVYHITKKDDGSFLSKVYALVEPKDYIEAWKEPVARFKDLTPEGLKLREGCGVHLNRPAYGAYAGSTEGNGCTSTMKGASYATSEVEVFVDRVISWDRGFDDQGRQVWGAEKGGYVFVGVR